MSCKVSLIVYRFPVPHLLTERDSLDYLRPILGEPDVLDEYDGEVEYFSYPTPETEVTEDGEETERDVKDFIRPCRDLKTRVRGIEVILAEYIPSYNAQSGLLPNLVWGKGLKVSEIARIHQSLLDLGFGEDVLDNAQIHAYTYYNGTDNPVTFDSAKTR